MRQSSSTGRRPRRSDFLSSQQRHACALAFISEARRWMWAAQEMRRFGDVTDGGRASIQSALVMAALLPPGACLVADESRCRCSVPAGRSRRPRSCQSVSQSVCQPVGRSASQSVSQSTQSAIASSWSQGAVPYGTSTGVRVRRPYEYGVWLYEYRRRRAAAYSRTPSCLQYGTVASVNRDGAGYMGWSRMELERNEREGGGRADGPCILAVIDDAGCRAKRG